VGGHPQEGSTFLATSEASIKNRNTTARAKRDQGGLGGHPPGKLDFPSNARSEPQEEQKYENRRDQGGMEGHPRGRLEFRANERSESQEEHKREIPRMSLLSRGGFHIPWSRFVWPLRPPPRLKHRANRVTGGLEDGTRKQDILN
jgi:hypothetical protein